jgi:hypothetical protein
MELLLMLTYAAVCVVGFILLVMNYNHPFTDNARVYAAPRLQRPSRMLPSSRQDTIPLRRA